MANRKTGFMYYNIDTDRYQDLRIKRLKNKYGANGLVVYDFILCEIYRDKGYYIQISDELIFDIAEYFRLDEIVVKEVIECCLGLGLFDPNQMAKHLIFTSRSIQDRYIEMCQRAKRTDIEIEELYMVIPEESAHSSGKSAHYSEESAHYSGSLPQSKVKKSKVKESRGIPAVELINPFSEDFKKTTWEKWKDYRRYERRKPITGPVSENTALEKLFEMSKGDEVIAREIIRKSIANNWQGLFQLDEKDIISINRNRSAEKGPADNQDYKPNIQK